MEKSAISLENFYFMDSIETTNPEIKKNEAYRFKEFLKKQKTERAKEFVFSKQDGMNWDIYGNPYFIEE
ncbi:MAG: hypothetical protein Q8T03_01320 [Bacteroidota bacterium]|nr:hypothetical protein [Bacteroidota bacterium]